MKKLFKCFGIFVAVIAAFVIAAVCIWWGELRTICTVEQVGDNEYLYTMEYKASYDLDDLLANNVATNNQLLDYILARLGKGIIDIENPASSKEDFFSDHCTSFSVENKDGGRLYGRNYDFYKNPTMVTISRPADGYASISIGDMAHFGYGLDKLPVSFSDKVLCLASIYAPMDGLNEKGLCTSIMALPKQPAQQNTGKPKVGTSILMRLFLDRCATVDEALNLLATVDVCHDVESGSGYHYMVADAQGNSAVIEFDPKDGWKTMILKKDVDSLYQHVTNHLLNPKYLSTDPNEEVGNPHSKSWWRYDTVAAYLSQRGGVLTIPEVQECLSQVHWKDLVWGNGMHEDTQYSAVYDQKNFELYLRNWNEYDSTYRFCLKK